MIAHWMLYCTGVALLLGLGALALERALSACGRATRGAWLAALLLALAVPAAARLFPRAAPPVFARASASAPAAIPAAAPASVAPEGPAEAPLRSSSPPKRVDLAAWDRPLLALWGASSAAALLALGAMGIALARRRRGWRAAETGGVPVLVSADTGPAVVGLLRPRIVLPAWACAADEEVVALMLEHEREHVRAGDTRLLAVALLALAAAPWNPALWWQLRRLRLAVEVDCDARVLRRRGDVRAYGALLLEVGRRAPGSRLAAAALSEPASFLERRIREMTRPAPRHPWLRAAAFATVAAALVVAACEAPGPVQSPIQPPLPPAESAALTPREAVARHYPEVLTRGMGGNEYILFMLNPEGHVFYGEMARRDTRNTEWTRLATDGGMDGILSVEEVKTKPGELGPDAVDIVWVRSTRSLAIPWTMAVGGKAPLSNMPVDVVAFGERIRASLPDVARAGRADARVSLGFTVGVDGRAKDVVVFPAHPQVVRAGMEVVSGTRFSPDLRGDTPVESWATLNLDFGAVARGANPSVGQSRVPYALLEAAVRRHHPEVAAGRGAPEHWFLVDAAGRVLHTGPGRFPGVRALRVDDVDTISQQARVEVDGHYTAVTWIAPADPRRAAGTGEFARTIPGGP